MKVRICGIIKFKNDGHSYVDVVVKAETQHKHKRHRLGVDIKPNRGKIITFLGDIYNVPAGQIVWPAHIEL